MLFGLPTPLPSGSPRCTCGSRRRASTRTSRMRRRTHSGPASATGSTSRRAALTCTARASRVRAVHGRTPARLESDRRPFHDVGAALRRHRRFRRRRHERLLGAPGQQPGQPDALHLLPVNNRDYVTETASLQPYVGYWLYARQAVYLTFTQPIPPFPFASRSREQIGPPAHPTRGRDEVSSPHFLCLTPENRYNLDDHGARDDRLAALTGGGGLGGRSPHGRGHPDRRLPDLPPDDARQGDPRLADHLGPGRLRAHPGLFLVGAAPRAELDFAADVPGRRGRHRHPIPARTAPRPGRPGAARLLGQGLHRPGQRGPDHHGRRDSSAPPARCPTARSAR